MRHFSHKGLRERWSERRARKRMGFRPAMQRQELEFLIFNLEPLAVGPFFSDETQGPSGYTACVCSVYVCVCRFYIHIHNMLADGLCLFHLDQFRGYVYSRLSDLS